MLRPLVLLVIACGLSLSPASAQGTVNGDLNETSTGPYAVGSTFEATLRLSATPGAQGLGTSTFVIDFDSDAMTFSASPVDGTDYVFANYAGNQTSYTGGFAGYNSQVVRTNPGRLTVVIDLGFTSDANGQALTDSQTDVVALRFEVADPGLSSMLAFTNVQAFNGSGSAYTNGTFDGLDTQLPVELASFAATVAGESVELQWGTLSETNNAYFLVERVVETNTPNEAGRNDGDERGAFVEIGRLDGAGSTSEPQAYSFNDSTLPFSAQRARYRLRQVDFDGAFSISSEVEVEVGLPATFQVHPVFPNPVQAEATLRYELPVDAEVAVTIYDLLGRRVMTTVDEQQPAGRYEQPLDLGRLASGVYFCEVRTDTEAEVMKLTVVR